MKEVTVDRWRGGGEVAQILCEGEDCEGRVECQSANCEEHRRPRSEEERKVGDGGVEVEGFETFLELGEGRTFGKSSTMECKSISHVRERIKIADLASCLRERYKIANVFKLMMFCLHV